ncbi:MAG TPA: PD-(D/E)XK nuclease family protein [Nostocaceae cyanobacterium]|nr:PD-(D/E)XK nuclease family protein [Nostocaceae cyanobacterium]
MTLTTAESRELLEKFIVDNQELEELEAKIAEFNIFEAIGVVRQEIRHSNFLAFLLDPSQNHRLDDIFLKRFLKRVLLESDEITNEEYIKISPVDIDIADLTDVIVRREWQNIDIFIHSQRTKLVCVIENKIDSSDYLGQLEKYQKIVESQYPNYHKILIYLTPEGIESNDEESRKTWRVYSYAKIVEILDNIYINYKSTLGTEVLTLINHYSTLIRRHIVSNSEIAELCRKIYAKHKQALDIIFENRPDLQLEISEKLNELLKKGINSQEICIFSWSKTYISFCPKKWKDNKLRLDFVFDNFSNYLAINLRLHHNENPFIHQRIYTLLSKESHKKFFKKSKVTAKDKTMYKREILNHKDYEDSDLEELMNKIYDTWNDFINDFVYVEKIIDENLDQLIE